MDALILVKKRLGQIEKRRGQHPLQSTDKDVKDLLSQCQGTDSDNVTVCSTVLMHAVTKKWINADSLINDIQIIMPTASHPHSLVVLLLDLMRHQQSLTKCLQTSLLVRRHPLVSANTNSNKLLRVSVNGCIELLKKHPDVHSLTVTNPFFKYLLLQPTQSPVADVLHEELLQFIREESPLSPKILDTLFSLVPFYRCQTIDDVLSTTGRVSSLYKTVTSCYEENQKSVYIDQLVHYCFSLCMESTSLGLSLLELVVNLKELFQLRQQITISDCLCLSWLIVKHLLDPIVVKHLLGIVQYASSSVSPFLLSLFKLPLILLVSQIPPTGSGSVWNTNRKLANQLLSEIETHHTREDITDDINSDDAVNGLGGNLINMKSSMSSQYSGMCCVAVNSISFLMGKLSSSDWLVTLPSDLNADDTLSLVIIICAIDAVRVPTLVSSFYSALPLSVNSMGSIMATYAVYTLGKTTDRELRFNLLQSLPSFCSNPLSTEMVTSILLTFTKTPDLLPSALRLLTKSWEKEDKVFPCIPPLLLPPVPGKVEWCIASAACLRDICRLRPEQHGEECLPYISQLLSYSTHPLAISLLVSALTGLCVKGIVEPAVLWKLLGSQLSLVDNPGVDKALCEFFELAADDDIRGDHNQTFRKEALKHLWNMTLKPGTETLSSSVKAIVSFPLESLTRQILPETLLNLLPVKIMEGANESPDIVLSNAELLLIFLTVTRPKEKSDCLKMLIKYLVEREVEAIPRGTVYAAMQKINSSKVMEKTKKEIEQFLRSCSSIERAPTIFHLMTDNLTEHQSFAKQRDKLMSIIKKTLVNGVFTELCVLSEGISWNKIMALTIETQIKVNGARIPESGQKRDDLVTKAINELLIMLRDLIRDNIFTGLGAVIGLVCSELTYNINPNSLSLLLEYIAHYLNTCALPLQTAGPLSDAFKVLLTTAKAEDSLRSILLYIPVLTNFLSQYPLMVAQFLTGQLKNLASDLVALILKNSDPKITSLACFATSAVIQDLSFVNEAMESLFLFFQLQKGIKIDANQSPLFIGAVMLLKETQFDCLNTYKELLELMLANACTIEDLKVLCSSISSSLPLLFSTGSVSIEDSMTFIQILADFASTHSHVPEFHWILGTTLHDLYIVGASTVKGLIEKLALKWIQENLTLEKQDINQVRASLLGLAGLLGLSPLNHKFKGCFSNNFMQTLLLSSLPLIYQCISDTEETLRSTGLWILTQLYTRTEWEEEKVPEDLSYLPEGSSLTILYTQLGQYCNNRSEVLITASQATSIIQGLSDVVIPLPVANWGMILLPMLSNVLWQRSVIKFIINQSSCNSANLRSLAEFVAYPVVLYQMKKECRQDLCLGLASMTDTLSPSSVFFILNSCLSNEVIASQAVLHLLSNSSSNKLKPYLEITVQLVGQSVEAMMKFSTENETLQPSNSFFHTLNQCLSLTSVQAPVCLKAMLNCSSIVSGDSHPSLLSSSISDYLASQLSPLEEKWLFYAIKNICSTSKGSYSQVLLLTMLQDWSKEHEPFDMQLQKVMLLLFEIVGARAAGGFNAIKWPMHQLKDAVKQKLCEVAVIWLLKDTEPFHSVIQGLLCDLRHTSYYCTTAIWTSVAQLL